MLLLSYLAIPMQCLSAKLVRTTLVYSCMNVYVVWQHSEVKDCT